MTLTFCFANRRSRSFVFNTSIPYKTYPVIPRAKLIRIKFFVFITKTPLLCPKNIEGDLIPGCSNRYLREFVYSYPSIIADVITANQKRNPMLIELLFDNS